MVSSYTDMWSGIHPEWTHPKIKAKTEKGGCEVPEAAEGRKRSKGREYRAETSSREGQQVCDFSLYLA